MLRVAEGCGTKKRWPKSMQRHRVKHTLARWVGCSPRAIFFFLESSWSTQSKASLRIGSTNMNGEPLHNFDLPFPEEIHVFLKSYGIWSDGISSTSYYYKANRSHVFQETEMGPQNTFQRSLITSLNAFSILSPPHKRRMINTACHLRHPCSKFSANRPNGVLKFGRSE